MKKRIAIRKPTFSAALRSGLTNAGLPSWSSLCNPLPNQRKSDARILMRVGCIYATGCAFMILVALRPHAGEVSPRKHSVTTGAPPADPDQILSEFRRLIDDRFEFVVLENGTCVATEAVDDFDLDVSGLSDWAIVHARLDQLLSHDFDFNPIQTESGHVLTLYSAPGIYSMTLAKEIRNHRDRIRERYMNWLFEGEVLEKKSALTNQMPLAGKVGLMSRSRLLRDIQDVKIAGKSSLSPIE